MISSARAACSLGLSATSQQYFSLTTNQPPATSQQYFSLRINQHQTSATSQTNRPVVDVLTVDACQHVYCVLTSTVCSEKEHGEVLFTVP
jgi:hypothetical protein